MDENGEILLLHASKNNMRLFVLPFYMTLGFTTKAIFGIIYNSFFILLLVQSKSVQTKQQNDLKIEIVV